MVSVNLSVVQVHGVTIARIPYFSKGMPKPQNLQDCRLISNADVIMDAPKHVFLCFAKG